MSWQPALVAAVGCAAGGALVPSLIARLPEPAPDPEAPPDEPAKMLYSDLGRRPGLLALCAVVSAVVGAVIAAAWGWDWLLVLLLPLVPVGVLLSVVDGHTRLLPKVVVLPATAAALCYGLARWAATGSHDELLRGVIGLVATRTFFWLLWFVRRAGMGFGDVRLAALLGCVLGYADGRPWSSGSMRRSCCSRCRSW